MSLATFLIITRQYNFQEGGVDKGLKGEWGRAIILEPQKRIWKLRTNVAQGN